MSKLVTPHGGKLKPLLLEGGELQATVDRRGVRRRWPLGHDDQRSRAGDRERVQRRRQPGARDAQLHHGWWSELSRCIQPGHRVWVRRCE